jgi:hypothetical protein
MNFPYYMEEKGNIGFLYGCKIWCRKCNLDYLLNSLDTTQKLNQIERPGPMSVNYIQCIDPSKPSTTISSGYLVCMIGIYVILLFQLMLHRSAVDVLARIWHESTLIFYLYVSEHDHLKRKCAIEFSI